MIDQLRRLGARITQLVGVGRLAVIDDGGDQQMCQVQVRAGAPEGLEEVIDTRPRLGEYGLAYCPPDGSEAIVIFLGGRRSQGVVIATGHRASRPKGLKPGEAMLYNGLTGDFVKMCQDGKIRSQGDWFHTGKFHASDNITSEKEITDHTAADGTGGVTLKTLRDDYNAHKHTGVTAGGASSGTTDHPAT